MAGLGVKKGSNKIKRHGHVTPFAIQALPSELVVDIFAKVASRSIVDLCKVKLSCKEFLRAAEDDRVYHRASMDNFALVPLPWFTHGRQSSFLRRCRESGNSEISYREGMVEYFSCLKVASGIENLSKAAMDGHDDAKYVYCMILMCGDDEGERNKGFGIFRCLKTSTCIVRRCRKRVRSFVRSMWVNNPVVRRSQESLCRSSACESNVALRNLPRRWLIDDDEDNAISCEYCLADYELGLFCNMFEA